MARRSASIIVSVYTFVHGGMQLFVGPVGDRFGKYRTCAVICAVAAVFVAEPANRVIVSGIPSACLVTAAAFFSRKRINPSWPELALARLGDASYSICLAQVQTVSLASTTIASLVPVVPPLLLVIVTCGIVVALGLLLNILAERPLLNLCRRIGPRRAGVQLIPEMRASGK